VLLRPRQEPAVASGTGRELSVAQVTPQAVYDGGVVSPPVRIHAKHHVSIEVV
jgi:hypothetical protein